MFPDEKQVRTCTCILILSGFSEALVWFQLASQIFQRHTKIFLKLTSKEHLQHLTLFFKVHAHVCTSDLIVLSVEISVVESL